MDVEELLALAKIADDVVKFLRRILQTLRSHSAAKVKTVIGAVDQFGKAFEPLHHRPVPTLDPAQYRRRRIIEMACHLHLVRLGHRNHPLQPIGRPFKGLLATHHPRIRQRFIVVFR